MLQLEAALESHQRMVSDKLSVGELMTTQMTALEPVMLVSKLEGVLRRCAHQAFPITTEVDKAFAASKTPSCITHRSHRIAFAASKMPACHVPCWCHCIAWQHSMRTTRLLLQVGHLPVILDAIFIMKHA